MVADDRDPERRAGGVEFGAVCLNILHGGVHAALRVGAERVMPA
jgi:hypothetical protein